MSHNENEIERVWIINAKPNRDLIINSSYHEIGYLLTTNPEDEYPGELRVYRKDVFGEWECGITVKSMGDLSRKEWEDKKLPKWSFDILWKHTEGTRVYKTRYYSPLKFNGKDLLLEIDEYEGNLTGLVRLECEFESEEQANGFWLPSWVDEPVEVTHDKRFKNSKLATLSREEYLELMDDLAV